MATLAGLGLLAAGAIVVDGQTDHLGKADVAVVLGSKVNADGSVSVRLAARLDRALAIYRDGLAPLIIVSGAKGAEGYDEARVMKAYLAAHGVPDAAIIEDPGGHNTRATAIDTAAWMKAHGATQAIAVTQYFHIPRTRLALKQAGIATVYTAHAHLFELRDVYSTAREMAGYAQYLARLDHR